MQLDGLLLPESIRAALSAILHQLADTRLVERLWARDAGLWHPSAATQARIAERLAWLDLPFALSAELPIRRWLAQLDPGHDVVFVATEAAQSGIRLWRDLSTTSRRLTLLDTIDPAVVEPMLATVEWRRTALVLAAAELTPEMEALADRVLDARSRQSATPPVTLLTSPESTLARRYATIQGSTGIGASAHTPNLIALPADLGERFGACSALGLLPAALSGYDLESLTTEAVMMRAFCQQNADLAYNPGVLLGALLGVLAQHGRDTLTLLTSSTLAPLAEWIAGFVAASLGKHGRGFVPILAEPLGAPRVYRSDRSFVALRRSEQPDAVLDQQIAALRAAGQPVIVCTLNSLNDLLAHQLCWQVAAAVAASIIGVNPFDEPDTVAMRDYIQRRLAEPPPLARESQARSDPSVDLSDALPLLRSASWIALVSYMPLSPQQTAALSALRRLLLDRAGLASLVVYPLRDHVYSVQLLHAGRPGGVMLVLQPPARRAHSGVAPSERLAALSNMRLSVELAAWRRMQRAVVELELAGDSAAELRALYAALDKLL